MVEPTRLLVLRWGTYRGRYLAGLGLIIAGLLCVQGGSAYFGLPLGAGALAHAGGWWIMPAAGWRRIWSVGPSLIVTFVLLIGPAGVGLLAVSFACWLLVRHRPLRSYALALPVLGVGIVLREFLYEYSGMLPALGIMAVVVVGCAWLAFLLARTRRPPSIPH